MDRGSEKGPWGLKNCGEGGRLSILPHPKSKPGLKTGYFLKVCKGSDQSPQVPSAGHSQACLGCQAATGQQDWPRVVYSPDIPVLTHTRSSGVAEQAGSRGGAKKKKGVAQVSSFLLLLPHLPGSCDCCLVATWALGTAVTEPSGGPPHTHTLSTQLRPAGMQAGRWSVSVCERVCTCALQRSLISAHHMVRGTTASPTRRLSLGHTPSPQRAVLMDIASGNTGSTLDYLEGQVAGGITLTDRVNYVQGWLGTRGRQKIQMPGPTLQAGYKLATGSRLPYFPLQAKGQKSSQLPK